VKDHAFAARRAATWGLVAYIVVLGFVALWPTPVDRAGGELLLKALRRLHRWGIPDWADYALVESVSNVLLFVPLGALMVLLLGRRYWWAAPAAGVLLSSLIELAQFLFLPARYPALADVAANTLGAALGAGLALLTTTRRNTAQIPPPARTL
jgi:glycopeptide antibiotics resistance protein